MEYSQFFTDVTGHAPYPYQSRLATAPLPEILDIPTGLGKTSAVIVAWLWRLLQNGDAPRRLVYCLPMRVLVEQIAQVARVWMENACPSFEQQSIAPPTVHVLMGGELDECWERSPESSAILVGTQDMLLSRALNRGYAMSRYRWPVHFALLNNDCLWIYDETQVMGVGLETGAQLQVFRQNLGTLGPGRSLWMSATLDSTRLATVDRPAGQGGLRQAGLTTDDAAHTQVHQRLEASKPVQCMGPRAAAESLNAYAPGVAKDVLNLHAKRPGLTLVVLNRVGRAQAVYQAMIEQIGSGAAEGGSPTAIGLIHSRYRKADRASRQQLLHTEGNRIVVATQALEAGVDVSARTLVTELAPWPSLVQRFGRCNRAGEFDDAQVWWLDLPVDDPQSDWALPYPQAELVQARAILMTLDQAAPGRLRKIGYEPLAEVRPVLRRKDLLDLFDNTPDLCGNDLDVSRFVRDSQDTDAHFIWRDFDGDRPSADLEPPHPEELCAVSLNAAAKFLKQLKSRRRKQRGQAGGTEIGCLKAWTWSPLDRDWQPATQVRPGRVYLLHAGAGGYDPDLGWTGRVAPGKTVPAVTLASQALPDAMDADLDTIRGAWILLADHLDHVRSAAKRLAMSVDLPDALSAALISAATWHDVGKAHEQFQNRLISGDRQQRGDTPSAGPWAKSVRMARSASESPESSQRGSVAWRPYFRHELASALAWLQSAQDTQARPTLGAGGLDLVAYLIAAHHGKVRLSIRSAPGEIAPENDTRLFARGVWDGDLLPEVILPGGQRIGPIALDLSPMRMGDGSWLERMLHLRDAPELGPFRIAFLEALLRIADWGASADEEASAAGQALPPDGNAGITNRGA